MRGVARVGPVDVVTMGETMLALLANDGLGTSQAHTFTATIAGAEANVACALARLGHTVTLLGRTGDDPSGRRVHARLRAEGVDTGHLHIDPDRPTGLLLRDTPSGRPITVEYHRANSAGAALSRGDLDTNTLRSAKALHVTGLTAALSSKAAAAVEVAMVTARQAGVHVTYDPNVRLRVADPDVWRELHHRLVGNADTVLVGDTEMEVLGVPEAAAVLAHGPSMVVVKQGAAGATATDGTTTWNQPARSVPVIDPVGAGDAFAAGWISGHLDQLDVAGRLQRACAIASVVVATRGDIEGMPTRAEVQRLTSPTADVLR